MRVGMVLVLGAGISCGVGVTAVGRSSGVGGIGWH